MAVLDAFRLDGKVALVTGAGSGIGLAAAQGLAEAGADVACLDLDAARAEAAAASIRALGRRALALAADVTDEAAVVDAFARTAAELDAPTAVFANAGIAGVGSELADFPLDEWRTIVDVDLTSVFLTIREAARHMIPRGYGKIVSTASIYGLAGDALFNAYPYTAAKHGVVGLTKTAAAQLAQHGVRVNAIAPGFTRTNLADGILLETDDPEKAGLHEELARRTPLGTLAVPADLQGLVLFLCAPASDYVTGVTVPIDGGFVVA